MANTSKFDREQVLNKATRLFWQKGFHATSARELQQALDMRPGSIYGAFGNKSTLFRLTLNKYADDMMLQLQQHLSDADSILAGVKSFFLTQLGPVNEQRPCEQCYLAKSLSELEGVADDGLNEVQELLNAVEQQFTFLVKAAQEQGELPAAIAPDLVAKYWQVQLMGMRSFLKANNQLQAQSSQLCRQQVMHLLDCCFQPDVLEHIGDIKAQ